jgi:hypothetical protein
MSLFHKALRQISINFIQIIQNFPEKSCRYSLFTISSFVNLRVLLLLSNLSEYDKYHFVI